MKEKEIFTEKVENALDTCMTFDGEKHLLFSEDIEYMFSWEDLEKVKETSIKIVNLINETMESNKENYNSLFDLEISELIDKV